MKPEKHVELSDIFQPGKEVEIWVGDDSEPIKATLTKANWYLFTDKQQVEWDAFDPQTGTTASGVHQLGDDLSMGLKAINFDLDFKDQTEAYINAVSEMYGSISQMGKAAKKPDPDVDLSQITADLENLPDVTEEIVPSPPVKSTGGEIIPKGLFSDMVKQYQQSYLINATKAAYSVPLGTTALDDLKIDPTEALKDAFSTFAKELQHGLSTGTFAFPEGKHEIGVVYAIPPGSVSSLMAIDTADPFKQTFKTIKLTLKEE